MNDNNVSVIERLSNSIKDLEKEINEQKKLIVQKEKIFEEMKKELEELNINEEKIEKIKKQREKSFNGLSASEWAALSRSVWNDVSSTRNKKHLDHGATFPEKLAERVINMYSKKGDIIFDPFLGTGTTGMAAINNQRKFLGIELNSKYYSYSLENLKDIENNIKNDSQLSLFDSKQAFESDTEYKIFNGDCLEKIDEIDKEAIQLTFTSPPYANLIHIVTEDREKRHKNSAFVTDNNATTKIYSDSELDFGNMSIEIYSKNVEKLMRKIYEKTKKGGYNIWVVKDYRDMQSNIPYVDLHTIIAKCGENVGFKYHDLIIWDQNQHRKLVLLGYPSRFYVNQNHSYLVVMRKW